MYMHMDYCTRPLYILQNGNPSHYVLPSWDQTGTVLVVSPVQVLRTLIDDIETRDKHSIAKARRTRPVPWVVSVLIRKPTFFYYTKIC